MVCSEPPSAVRAAIRPMATRAAIRPYSIAVAPDSSFAKDLRVLSIWMGLLSDLRLHQHSGATAVGPFLGVTTNGENRYSNCKEKAPLGGASGATPSIHP